MRRDVSCRKENANEKKNKARENKGKRTRRRKKKGRERNRTKDEEVNERREAKVSGKEGSERGEGVEGRVSDAVSSSPRPRRLDRQVETDIELGVNMSF